MALHDAYDWAESLCDAYSNDTEQQVVKDHRRIMDGYERVALKLFGKSIRESKAKRNPAGKTVSIYEIIGGTDKEQD